MAQALQDAGLEPTIDRVREKLGTGSKSTLAPLLKRWKGQRETTTLGQGLPADLLAAVKGLHDRAQQAGVAQIETARQVFEDTEAALRQQLADRERAFSTLQDRHQTLGAELTDLRKAHQALVDTHRRECTATAALRAELGELRARLADAQTTNTDLKQELRHVRDSAEHYQQAVAEERRLEREHVQQLKSEWQAARDDWNRRLTAETAARQTAETDARQLATLNQQQERLHVEQHAEPERRQSELQRLQQSIEKLEPQLQALRAERLRSAVDLAELRTVRDQQDTLKAQQDQRMQALEAKLTKAEDRMTQLLDENRFLLQEKADLQIQTRLLQSDVLKPEDRNRQD